MKRGICTLFIALSTVVLLGAMIIPHHHHHGRICFELLQDDDAPDGCHHESCVAEAEFIVPHFHLFTEFFILSEEVFDYEKEYQLLAEIEYGEPVTFYKSAEIHSFHGLRAPPLLSYL